MNPILNEILYWVVIAFSVLFIVGMVILVDHL